MSVRKLFGLTLAAITVIIIAFSATLGWRTIHQIDELRIAMMRVEAIKSLANIQGFISSERGAITLALNHTQAGDKAGLAALQQVGQLTDNAMVDATTRVAFLAKADPEHAYLSAIVDTIALRVADSRSFYHERLTRRIDERGDAAQRTLDQMNDVLQIIPPLLRNQVSLLATVDGSAYAAGRIANEAANLRAVAGAQAGLLQEFLINARAVSTPERDRFLVYEGQVQEIWDTLLASLNDSATRLELVNAIDDVRINFLEAYKALRDEMMPHLHDGRFGMDGGTFRLKTQPLYGAVIGLRDRAYDVALNDVRNAYGQARQRMIITVIATLLTLLVLYAVFIFANRKLASLALDDILTGLPNRLFLEDRLAQVLNRAERNNGHFAVMFLDIDNFKTVNDACGHHVGDELLKATAHRIAEVLHPHDTLARVGGDEFILLYDIKEPGAPASVAQQLIDSIDRPLQIGGHELAITVSIGISIFPDDARTPHDLMINADTAMYHAKYLGKNCYCFYESMMAYDAKHQLLLQHDLHMALERAELELHFQPKVLVATGAISGAEALVRWRHPTRGLVQPDQFITLAEKTGLIIPIGSWVLDEACRQIAEWHKMGHPEWTIAVNLSPLQFVHSRLAEDIRDALARHAVPPGSLTLEITETTAMRNADASIAVLSQLAALGVHISIDDFGTGYSSLLYLKRFSATELKIDRGFVTNLVRDSEDAAIVSAVIALGKTLNMQVVAEGVENETQQALLTQLGCHILQGYYLGRPMPAPLFYDMSREFRMVHPDID